MNSAHVVPFASHCTHDYAQLTLNAAYHKLSFKLCNKKNIKYIHLKLQYFHNFTHYSVKFAYLCARPDTQEQEW